MGVADGRLAENGVTVRVQPTDDPMKSGTFCRPPDLRSRVGRCVVSMGRPQMVA
jgi:hypothetical protein